MIQALPHAAANPSPAEWRTLLANVQAYSGGLCNIEFLNMNNYGQPLMLAGSVFELNGRKYICTQDHPIEWEAPPTTWRAGFIYARVPTTGGEVSLTMRTCDDLRDGIAPEHAPRWQPAKGGWYASFNDTADQSGHTNFNDRRVIAKFFYGAANQWRNKVVLSRYNSRFENNLYNVNSTFPYVSGDGALYYSAPEMAPLADTDELVTRSFTASNKTYLCPGVYRYEMRGGNAGRAGAGGPSLWWGSLQVARFALPEKKGARVGHGNAAARGLEGHAFL